MWVYQDATLPQDACQADFYGAFKKKSASARLGPRTIPFATGLSPMAGFSAAASPPSFYGGSLVAWTPAHGCGGYDVEWSRTQYPWKAAGGSRRLRRPRCFRSSPAPGGIGFADQPVLPGNQRMSWSNPVRLRIATPTFRVVGG